MRSLNAIVVALLCACGSPAITPADATVPDAEESDAASLEDTFFNPRDANWDSNQPDVDPYSGYNVIDGGPSADGSWEPCKNSYPNKYAFGCCNGETCVGFCEGLPDESARCSCFGIVGGCATLQAKAFCCTGDRGCTALACGPSGQ
ncbi:hypothetical protein BH09MYX1_BH09MYX1_63840 [soil metagenome]